MAVISINYEEGSRKKNLGYESVDLHFFGSKKEKKKVFKTGSFVRDWFLLNKFIALADLQEPIMHSSSVDHFIMDGAPYDSAHLCTKNDVDVFLYYRDDTITDIKQVMLNDALNPGIEFFVHKGDKPTWQELRQQCTRSYIARGKHSSLFVTDKVTPYDGDMRIIFNGESKWVAPKLNIKGDKIALLQKSLDRIGNPKMVTVYEEFK